MKDQKKKSFTSQKVKQIRISEDQIKTVKWVHYLLLGMLLVLISFSIVNILWTQLFWHFADVVDYPLHSSMEAVGAIAAILVAFMPLQVLFGKYKPSYIFLSAGFLMMGLWGLFHSFYEIGNGFVFTHSIALLAGGFFFALFVFPWKINADKIKPRLLFVVGSITILLGIISLLNQNIFPEMVHNNVFTLTANRIYLIAGLFFLISAVKIISIYIKEKNLGVVILLFTAVSSAIVGFNFQYSEAWSDSWWLWHIIRLIAFLAFLGYLFLRIQTINNERNEALQSLKENHKQLMESEERFNLVNEATGHGLWDWDVINNEVYFSPVWKMQVGYQDDELENDFENWVKLFHPEDKERSLKAVDDYLKNPAEKFVIEFRFRHKQGHYIWIHDEAASVKDEKGNVTRMFGAHTDITAEKEAEEKIRKSELNFRNIFSNSPVSIWQEDWTAIIKMIDKLKKEGVKDFKKYFNENRQFVNEALTKVVINDVNPATLEMFEAESKDDLVKSLEVVFATEDTLPGFIGELIALAEGKQVFETEMKLNTAKGNLIHTMLRMAFPLHEIEDGQVLVIIMNINETKKTQEQLKVLMENLQRSNEELERFAYVASHDLQEPLRMVASYTQLLERRYKGQLDERADKYIYYAVDGAKRMQNLINDLLDFSRISTRGDEFTQTDTNEVVKNALKNLQARIDETGAQIKIGNLPLINADSSQIERLFLNLIGNALKFIKPDEKPLIEINAQKQKDKYLFSIKDNGIGIDEKFNEKVFIIFQRLHGAAQYKGTGIGLAICKRIVQRHEGEIWFESEENKGTTFFFTLKIKLNEI